MVILARLIQLRPWQQFLLGPKNVQPTSSNSSTSTGSGGIGSVFSPVRPPWTSHNLTSINEAKEKPPFPREFNFLPKEDASSPSIRWNDKKQEGTKLTIGDGFHVGAILVLGYHLFQGHYKLSREIKRKELRAIRLESLLDGHSTWLGALPLEDHSVEQIKSDGDQVTVPTTTEELTDFYTHPETDAKQEPTEGDDETSPKIFSKELEDIEQDLEQTLNLMSLKYQTALGLQLVREGGQERQKGIQMLYESAKEKDPQALHNLGVIFEKGIGVEANLAKAGKFYKKAAKQGFAPSIYNIAMFYKYGEGGFSKDLKKAEKLFKLAEDIEKTEQESNTLLGMNESCKFCSRKGWSPDENSLSASTDTTSDASSCYHLARAYHFGLLGLPVDKLYALSLYDSAAKSGHKEAKLAFELLLGELQDDCEVSQTIPNGTTPRLSHSRTFSNLKENPYSNLELWRRNSVSLTRLDSLTSDSGCSDRESISTGGLL